MLRVIPEHRGTDHLELGFDGRQAEREHPVADGDVVELHV
jgi:hypothetical protein